MRLFIAIPLERGMKERVRAVQAEFRSQQVTGNYTPAENLHVTLAFIGEHNDPDRVMDAIGSVRFLPFSITMDRLGRFEKLWWTGFCESRELETLARKVRRALSENGIPFDRKRFTPHVTIVRKPQFAKEKLLPVTVAPVSMTVDRVCLMQSTRGKNGMIYTEIGSVPASKETDPSAHGSAANTVKDNTEVTAKNET